MTTKKCEIGPPEQDEYYLQLFETFSVDRNTLALLDFSTFSLSILFNSYKKYLNNL